MLVAKNFRARSVGEKRKMLVLQELPIRTDTTVSDGNSAESTFRRAKKPAFLPPLESVLKRDQSSKTGRRLKTALGSSEIINDGKFCIYSR